MIVSIDFDLISIIAEWDDDMTYLYVDYPFYKKYVIFVSISAVSQIEINYEW